MCKNSEVVEIIAKIREEEGIKLFYDYLICESSNPGSNISMVLMVGPIKESEITIQLAKRIAEIYNVELSKYDFSKGKWSEPRDYGTVFSVIVPDEDCESVVQNLKQAYVNFRDAIRNLVENALEIKTAS